jgi:aminoglycoside 6'-N-acetyltransferase
MLILRKATITDREILELWDEQPHVMDSDPNDDWNWAYELTRDPDWREQLIAEVDGRPVGIVQIIDPAREETHYWGDISHGYRAIDIWIGMEEDLDKGYGTQMMTLSLDRCFKDPSVNEVLIDPLASNIKAIRFYERIGFEFVGERIFGKDQCKVYTFRRHTWESMRSHAS